MKKKIITFHVGTAGGAMYTAAVPDTSGYNNTNLNSQGSGYAARYGHQVSALITKQTKAIIYDAAPQQYFADLKILMQKAPEMKNSDEFFFHEMGFGRFPVILSTTAGVPAAASQTIDVENADQISKDVIVVYDDNSRGIVTSVNVSTGQIVVDAETGATLPAIPAVAAVGDYVMPILSPVEGDGAESISQYVRFDTIERTNYIQFLVKAMRFGKVEMEKYLRIGTFSNFLTMQRKRFVQQFRFDIANVYWNGNMAEVTLADGTKAKTADGIFPIMQKAGSPNSAVTMANTPAALEALALDTEYGEYGRTRFLYATPRLIHNLSKQYKSDLTRYTPDNNIAKLELSGVDIGSTFIVFVPTKTFEEPSLFPAEWRSRAILLDQININPVYFTPEQMGSTLSRVNGGTLQNFTTEWISASFSIEMTNPLACGWIDVTDL
jgi:hypothetical protein